MNENHNNNPLNKADKNGNFNDKVDNRIIKIKKVGNGNTVICGDVYNFYFEGEKYVLCTKDSNLIEICDDIETEKKISYSAMAQYFLENKKIDSLENFEDCLQRLSNEDLKAFFETKNEKNCDSKQKVLLKIPVDKIAERFSKEIYKVPDFLSHSKNYDSFKKYVIQLLEKDNYNNKIIEKELDTYIHNAIDDYLFRVNKIGSLIMADSIIDSLGDNPSKEDIKRIKKEAEGAKDKYFIFLSAITYDKKSQDKSHTLEYEVAKRLKKHFEKKGIGVFWWEDKNTNNDWKNISTKIAMGLGFSSIFIGLAFDTISYDSNNDPVYNCLLSGTQAYKSPNYFLYEVDTFANKLFNKKDEKKFVRKVVSKSQYLGLLPQKRYLRFYTYGKPKSYARYPMFDNKENWWVSIDKNNLSQLNKEDKITKIVEEIIRNLEELPFEKLKNDEWDHLYKPFEIKNIDETYMDTFLKDEGQYEKSLIRAADLNENYQIIPTDYFFEYMIIDEHGKNAKNHFLIFSEKSINGEGNSSWNLKLVVKDWNYSEIASKLNSEEQKIFDNAELNDYDKFQLYPSSSKLFEKTGPFTSDGKLIRKKDYNEHYMGSIGLRNYNGYILMFNEKKQAKFYYSINFTPKKILCYRVKNKSIHLKKLPNCILQTKIVSPDVGSEQRINPVGCLKKDSIGSTTNLTLSKHYTKDPKIGKGNRLCFEDLTDKNKYFFLKSIDSHFTYFSKPVKNKIHRCIYCGQLITNKSESCKEKCLHNYTYDIAEIKEDPNTKNKYIIYNYLKDETGENYQCFLDQKPPTPKLKMDLPTDFKKGMVISLIGQSQSGKSSFISSLFGVYEKKIHSTRINNALIPYVDCTSYYDDINVIKDLNLSERLLKEEYSPKILDNFITKTSTEFKKSLLISHTPQILKLERIQHSDENAYLSFFDVAGGLIFAENINSDENRVDNETYLKSKIEEKCPFLSRNDDYLMLYKSDCIILLVNGKPTPKVASNNEDDSNAQDELTMEGATAILEFITKYFGNDRKKKKYFYENTILAVVLCKFDEFAEYFDENSYVRMTPPTADSHIFENSERHKYIEISSKEIENYLADFASSILTEKVKEYEHHNYFVVSSIGRNDSIIKSGETKTVYLTKPHNIENLLLWVMYQKGLIK